MPWIKRVFWPMAAAPYPIATSAPTGKRSSIWSGHQASAAIPVMPLYIAMAFKVMKEKGLHEGCMEQIERLFRTQLYKADGSAPETDASNRIRLDDWELRDEVQDACKAIWPQVTTENLRDYYHLLPDLPS